jgi:hypothetical protein
MFGQAINEKKLTSKSISKLDKSVLVLQRQFQQLDFMARSNHTLTIIKASPMRVYSSPFSKTSVMVFFIVASSPPVPT